MAVTPAMIAVALGVTAPDSGSPTEAQWQMWIDDATMLIETQAAVLSVDFATLDEAKVDYVVREAVVAQARRPDDATQVTISVDDASTSKTYRTSRGRVAILDEWWALLGLVPSGGGAFDVNTVSTTGGHAPFCDLYFGGTACTCGAVIGTTYYRPSDYL